MTARKANPKKSVPPKVRSQAHAAKVSLMTEAIAAAEGVMPKDVMLRAMRELVADADKAKSVALHRRLMRSAADIAKDVAPYVHPRLASIEHKGQIELGFAEKLVKARERLGKA